MLFGIQMRQPGVELLDGVYIEWKMNLGGDSKNSNNGQSGGVETIPLIGSIYSMIANSIERGKIEEQVERFDRERVKTGEYRSLAKGNCKKIFDANLASFQLMETVAEKLKTSLATIDPLPLTHLQERFRGCLARLEDDFVNVAQVRARETVYQLLGEGQQMAFSLRTSLKAYERVYRNILSLRDTQCGSASDILNSLKADVAELQVFGAKTPQMEQALSGVRTELSHRRERCGIEVAL